MEGRTQVTECWDSASLPHAGILLKTETIILVKPNLKPKMDFDQFLCEQPQAVEKVCNCQDEIIGTIAIMNMLFFITLTTWWCARQFISRCCTNESPEKAIQDLKQRNKTLERIIFTAMESKILQAMNQADQEDLHED